MIFFVFLLFCYSWFPFKIQFFDIIWDCFDECLQILGGYRVTLHAYIVDYAELFALHGVNEDLVVTAKLIAVHLQGVINCLFDQIHLDRKHLHFQRIFNYFCMQFFENIIWLFLLGFGYLRLNVCVLYIVAFVFTQFFVTCEKLFELWFLGKL